MKLVTVFIYFAITFIFVEISTSENTGNRLYVKAVQCKVSEIIYKNLTCFAKSYSRTFSGVNLHATSRFALNDVKISFKVFFKYGTIYREVMTTPKVDVCTAVKLLKQDKILVNKWVATVAEIIEDTMPGVVHDCPYKNLIINNRSVNFKSVPSLFPSGDYKAIFTCHNGDDFVGVATIVLSITSANKDTFG